MPNGFIKNLEGETIEIVDAQSRYDITQVKEDICNIKSGLQKDAAYHLGFYLDENGDLCQVDNEEV